MPYNTTSGQCELATKGSTVPFNMTGTYVVMDRADGSTTNAAAYNANGASITNNATTSSTATSTASSSTGNTATSSPATSDSGTHDAAVASKVGAGVGVPLGVCLLLALGFLWQQWSQRRKLQRRLDELMGSTHHALPVEQHVPQQRQAYAPVPQSYSSNGAFEGRYGKPPEAHGDSIVELGERERMELDGRHK